MVAREATIGSAWHVCKKARETGRREPVSGNWMAERAVRGMIHDWEEMERHGAGPVERVR